MVFMDQLSGCLAADAAHHFTELWHRQNIGIIRETVAVTLSDVQIATASGSDLEMFGAPKRLEPI